MNWRCRAVSSAGASSLQISAWTSNAKGTLASPSFAHAIEGFESARHPDLEDILAEGADVRDHVDVTGLGLLGHRQRPLVASLGLREPRMQLGQPGVEKGALCLAGLRGLGLNLGQCLLE